MNTIENQENLLRLAARAAGIQGHVEHDGTILFKRMGNKVQMGAWNPLENTDEALELAEKLKIQVSFGNGSVLAQVDTFSSVGDISKGLSAELRRVIVQTAAHVASLPR